MRERLAKSEFADEQADSLVVAVRELPETFATKDRLDARLEKLEAKMSTYQPETEVGMNRIT